MKEQNISFFQELSRRRVVRVLSVYLAASFALLQLADVVFEPLGFPDWVMRGLIVVLLVGLPITAALSWIFDLTSDGLVVTGPAEEEELARLRKRQRIDAVLIAALLLFSLALLSRHYLFPQIRPQPAVAPAADRSVAVLPFTNIGADTADQYFADGLSVELINTLSMIPDLRVSSANSSLSLNQEMSDRDIGRTLRVAHLVRGTVRRAGERVRINVHLVRVADNAVIWTNTFENSLVDVFVLQDKISRDIATSLKSTLYSQVLLDMALANTKSTEAYNAYLLALHYRRRYEWADALEHATRAYQLDPEFTAAYALAARCYLTRVGGSVPASQAYPEGRRLVSEVLSIEADFVPALLVKAHLERIAGNYTEAESLFRRAKTLAPGISTQDLANLLLTLGRTDEALEEYRRSYELDPLGTYFYIGALIAAGNDMEAERVMKTRLSLLSGDQSTAEYFLMSEVLLRQGKIDEANHYADLALPKIDSGPTVLQGRAILILAQLGRQEQARGVFTLMQQRGEHRYLSPAGLFWAYLGLGEIDEAFAWLDEVVEQDVYFVIVGLLTSPIYDELRHDPRFERALERLGLSQTAGRSASDGAGTGNQ